jgi:tetratricopeptide (TPR) repeat protein
VKEKRFSDAVEHQMQFCHAVEREETKRDGKAGSRTALHLTRLAWLSFEAGNYVRCLEIADRAAMLFPPSLETEAYRAHALMFLGQQDEAGAVYLRHRGEKIDEYPWEQVISEQFSSMRADGQLHPQMEQIEHVLGSGHHPKSDPIRRPSSSTEYIKAVLALKRKIVLAIDAVEEDKENTAASDAELRRIEGEQAKGPLFIAQAFLARAQRRSRNENSGDALAAENTVELLLRALFWARRGGDRSLTARALLDLGDAQSTLGRYGEAITSFREAKRLGRTDADFGLWWAINWSAWERVASDDVVGGFIAIWINVFDLEPSLRKTIVLPYLNDNYALWGSIAKLHGDLHSSSFSGERTDCDIMGSHPWDPYRVAQGVSADALDTKSIIAACSRKPTLSSEPRLRYIRGRAHMRAGEIAAAAGQIDGARASFAVAIEDFGAAMAVGYPAAFNNMARMFALGEGVTKNGAREAELTIELLNRVIHNCALTVAQHLLSEENKHDKASVRRVVKLLLHWSAALGNFEARKFISELVERKIILPSEFLHPVRMADLPPLNGIAVME